MIRLFKRRIPTPPAPLDFQERYIAALYGRTPEEWEKLPALVKADLRESVAWELRAAS